MIYPRSPIYKFPRRWPATSKLIAQKNMPLSIARVHSSTSVFHPHLYNTTNSHHVHIPNQCTERRGHSGGHLAHGRLPHTPPACVSAVHTSALHRHTYNDPHFRGTPDCTHLSPAALTDIFNRKREILADELSHRDVRSQAVFTNSELSLKHVDVYGFDFDYTLLQYTPEVHKLIYTTARKRLVEKLSYPHGIEDMPYDPDFAIRGLHCDVLRGLLMKIDAYSHIHLSSVHRGHQQLSKEEVLEMYGGTHVPLRVTDDSSCRRDSEMVQFLDLFSIPEATLFADVMEYVSQREKQKLFPKFLFEDVQNTVKEIHTEGLIHDAIIEDIERYTKITPRLPEFLNRLKNAGKKLFLITNSPYWFVNAGMRHALGSPYWRDLFDTVIVQALKPSFYSNSDRPFRLLHPQSLNQTWKPVSSLERGQTYIQGNVRDFIKMTGWSGYRVLYFGDHVFSDLADPIMQLGWKTGAIIPELKTEIEKALSPEAKHYLTEILALENMLKNYQEYSTPELVAIMDDWKKRRTEDRQYLKFMFNPRFGSVFRTEKSPTYFSLRLSTFANLYMASIDDLMNYSLDYTFIPRRTALPHEPDLNFDLDIKLTNQDS